MAGDLKVKLDADTRAYELGMKRAETATASALATMDKINAAQAKMGQIQGQDPFAEYDAAIQKSTEQAQAALEEAGEAAAVFGAVTLAGFGVAANAAVQWETAWAGVMKTVEGSPEQMAALEEELRGLTEILPVTHEEIAGVAEAAGQLGVARADISAFTQVAVNMGVATNLSSEEASTGIAQMVNIMGSAMSDVDQFGSTIVALGNNGASTEADILAMSLRIAAAGSQAGMSEAEVLGFASALASMGIEAEAGGTAISQTFSTIQAAVIEGGTELETFAQVAGMSAEEYRQAFQEDAAGATVAFIEGLGGISDAGGNVYAVLDEVGLSGLRVRDTLLRTSGAGDLLVNSLDDATAAWEDNNALTEEAAKRYATTASQVQLAKNALNNVAIDIGTLLLPVLITGTEIIRGFAQIWQGLPGPVQAVLVTLGLAAGAAALFGGSIIVASTKLATFTAAMSTAAGRATFFRAAVATMTGPVGLAGVAIVAATLGLGLYAMNVQKAKAHVDELTSAIEADSGALAENSRAAMVATLESEGLLAAGEELGVSADLVTDAALGQAGAWEELNTILDANVDSHVRGGRASRSAQEHADNLRGALEGENEAVRAAMEAYDRKQAAMEGQGATSEEAATAANEAATAAYNEAAAQQAAAASIDNTSGSAEAAAVALDALRQAFDELNGGQTSVLESQAQYQGSLASLRTQLDSTTEAARNNGNALNANAVGGYENVLAVTAVADASMEAALAQYEQTAATQGADAAYDQFNSRLQGSRQELFAMIAPYATSEQAAWDLVDSVLAVPEQTDIDAILHDLATEGLINIGNTTAELDGQTATVRVTMYEDTVYTYKTIYYADGTADQGVPMYAEGGTPPVGRPVIVGEDGPELAVFGSPATIIPNSELRRYDRSWGGSGGSSGSGVEAGSSGFGNVTINVRTYPEIRARFGDQEIRDVIVETVDERGGATAFSVYYEGD